MSHAVYRADFVTRQAVLRCTSNLSQDRGTGIREEVDQPLQLLHPRIVQNRLSSHRIVFLELRCYYTS
ncbi:hypothetical protein D3C85_1038000 [compost metagenome]